MYVIPIVPETLELIEGLNGGIRPEPEEKPTYFVYRGKDEFPMIVTETRFRILIGQSEKLTDQNIYIAK